MMSNFNNVTTIHGDGSSTQLEDYISGKACAVAPPLPPLVVYQFR